MKIYVCDICGARSAYKMIKLLVESTYTKEDGSPIMEKINVCHNCIYDIPRLSTDIELEDLRK